MLIKCVKQPLQSTRNYLNKSKYARNSTYKEYNKIVLHRLENGYIEYSIYFIQDKDGKWYLTYLNYCDCSA